VSDRVGVGAAVDVEAGLDVGVGGGVAAVALGAGEAPARVAQAFVSADSTVRQTDFAVESHAVPSAAVRDKATRTKG
jgi:thiazole synthase ThiGH ThiG subunit